MTSYYTSSALNGNYRDIARKAFSFNKTDGFQYEYNTKMNDTDKTAFDYYNKQTKIIRDKYKPGVNNDKDKDLYDKSIYKQNRDILKILKKKKVNERQKQEVIKRIQQLENKKNNNQAYGLAKKQGNREKCRKMVLLDKIDVNFTKDDYKELCDLRNNTLINPEDRKIYDRYNDTTTCLYYKNAFKVLDAEYYIEYNKKKSINRDPLFRRRRKISEAPTCKVHVISEDPIERAIKFSLQQRAMLIISGSSQKPGGNSDKGEVGLEENLYYRSNIEMVITDESYRDGFYPLKDNTVLYTPRLVISRDKNLNSYEKVGMKYICAAIVSPGNSACLPITEKNKSILVGSIRTTLHDIYKNKLKNIFQTAIFHGKSTIIMDAFGPIKYNYDPAVCAKLINEVLHSNDFNKKIKFVYICINKKIFNMPKGVEMNDDLIELEKNKQLFIENIFNCYEREFI